MIEVMVYLWNISGTWRWFKLLSVPERPPMGHYRTLVVAGLSDHTVELSPLTIFNCTEVSDGGSTYVVASQVHPVASVCRRVVWARRTRLTSHASRDALPGGWRCNL